MRGLRLQRLQGQVQAARQEAISVRQEAEQALAVLQVRWLVDVAF